MKNGRQHKALSIDGAQYQWLPPRQNAFPPTQNMKKKETWTSKISSFSFVDFQLGFAQPIKVIARLAPHPPIPIVRLTSRIIHLWMSVHERLFDVFKNGSRELSLALLPSLKFRWFGKSQKKNENYARRRIRKKGKSTRATARAQSFLCSDDRGEVQASKSGTLVVHLSSSSSSQELLSLQA